MNNHINQIEKYFSGTMHQDEIAAFEKRQLTDKDFAREVLLYKQANELVQEGARKRLKQQLDHLGQQEFAFTMIDTYGKYFLLKKYWYAIAASILIVIGLAYFGHRAFYGSKSLPTLAQLYDSYYETPKTDLIISRGEKADETLAQVWNSALRKYSEGSFQDAIEDFSTVLANSSFAHTSAANLYLGICYLNLNVPDSAVAHFSKVSANSSLAQDASWYLGLSHLKAGNLTQASEAFKHITTSDKHYKKEEAQEILKVLSKSQ